MVGDILWKMENDKKKAKVHLWPMFAFNPDSHDCAEDQGLKFYSVRVTEPVSQPSTLAFMMHSKHLKCQVQALLRWRYATISASQQLLEGIRQRENLRFALSPQSHGLCSVKCVIVGLNSQVPICVSQHFNIIWDLSDHLSARSGR